MALNAVELQADSMNGFESDEGFCDNESTNGDDTGHENMRAYLGHQYGNILPDDSKETQQVDLQHHIFMMTTQNRLHLAPIKPNLQHVMDIGAGKGTWAVEFAQQYPTSRIQGAELFSNQAKYLPANAPPNLEANEDLHPDTKFDYIHSRMMTAPSAHPRTVLQVAFNALLPGGYLEMQDLCFPAKCDDGSLNGTAFARWNNLVLEGARRLGKQWSDPQAYKELMLDIGFVDVEEKIFTWPIGPWPKESELRDLSRFVQKDLLDGLKALSLAVMMKGLSWTEDQVEVFLTQVRRDVLDTHLHGYFSVYFVYGRKPRPVQI